LVPGSAWHLRVTINRQREGALSLTDDGFGTLRDGMNQDRGSVNYTSGQVDLEDIPNGTPCLAQYAFDSTPTHEINVKMTLTSTPIRSEGSQTEKGRDHCLQHHDRQRSTARALADRHQRDSRHLAAERGGHAHVPATGR
jgi:hypothetical protein